MRVFRVPKFCIKSTRRSLRDGRIVVPAWDPRLITSKPVESISYNQLLINNEQLVSAEKNKGVPHCTLTVERPYRRFVIIIYHQSKWTWVKSDENNRKVASGTLQMRCKRSYNKKKAGSRGFPSSSGRWTVLCTHRWRPYENRVNRAPGQSNTRIHHVSISLITINHFEFFFFFTSIESLPFTSEPLLSFFSRCAEESIYLSSLTSSCRTCWHVDKIFRRRER